MPTIIIKKCKPNNKQPRGSKHIGDSFKWINRDSEKRTIAFDEGTPPLFTNCDLVIELGPSGSLSDTSTCQLDKNSATLPAPYKYSISPCDPEFLKRGPGPHVIIVDP